MTISSGVMPLRSYSEAIWLTLMSVSMITGRARVTSMWELDTGNAGMRASVAVRCGTRHGILSQTLALEPTDW